MCLNRLLMAAILVGWGRMSEAQKVGRSGSRKQLTMVVFGYFGHKIHSLRLSKKLRELCKSEGKTKKDLIFETTTSKFFQSCFFCVKFFCSIQKKSFIKVRFRFKLNHWKMGLFVNEFTDSKDQTKKKEKKNLRFKFLDIQTWSKDQPNAQGCTFAHLHFKREASKFQVLQTNFLGSHMWFTHPVFSSLHGPCKV